MQFSLFILWLENITKETDFIAMPFVVEQVLLDQNSQTPPPSPFSVQAFNKGASCSAQGFDYGLGNNKGRCLKWVFYLT